MNYPFVSVVILHWNHYAATKRCLDSLLACTYPNMQVIVVDNGSKDDSAVRLQSEYADLRFIFNSANLGFARGCNAGIKEALQSDSCTYVLLLNNDATVTPGFLEPAVMMAESNKQIGLINGKMYLKENSNILASAGGFINRLRVDLKIRGLGEEDQGQYDEPCEITFVTCGFALISRQVLQTVGLLPEEYFFSMEEIDYSLQVRRAGFKLYYVPEFSCFHTSGGSHSDRDPKFIYNSYRNKLIFQEKYLPKTLFTLWLLAFKFYARFLAKRKWRQLETRYGYNDASPDLLHKALLQAIADHGHTEMTEATLIEFEQQLNKL